MDKEEIIRRLKNISGHAVHVVGEPPFIMSLDDGIALEEAARLLKEQEAVEPKVSCTEQRCGNCNKVIEMDGWKACPWCGKPIDWESWWNEHEAYRRR